ncbi:MAG: hypothetical protein ACRDS9_00385 [Pseudonocardiaceae bacterium]
MQRSRAGVVGAVREITVADKREHDRFISVERAAIADNPLAIREIAGDVHQRLRGRSPFYEESEHTAFLAVADGVNWSVGAFGDQRFVLNVTVICAST